MSSDVVLSVCLFDFRIKGRVLYISLSEVRV